MKHPRVEQQMTQLIVPFVYDFPYSSCQGKINNTIFEPKDIKPDRLFDHVSRLVHSDSSKHESIGRRWVLTQKGRNEFSLPNKHDAWLTCETKYEQWRFALPMVECYLFETQVGFVVFHVEFPNNTTINQMIESTYHLKKLASNTRQITFSYKTGRDTSEIVSIHLDELANKLVEPFQPSDFFEGNGTHPTQAMVFTSALLDTGNEIAREQISEYLFHMRRSFKASYRPSVLEDNWAAHPDLLPLFENSIWGASLEGLANIIIKTGDEQTDRFFSGPYFSNLKNTYAYFYILALHQRYALIHLSKKAAALPVGYGIDWSAQNFELTAMRKQIADFMLRSSYKQLSNNTHHTDLYELIRKRLKIDDLFSELHETLAVLSSLADMAEQRKQQEEENRKRNQLEDFNRKVTWITAIYLPLTIVTGLYGMNLTFMDRVKDVWWFFLALTGSLYVVTYLLFRYGLNKNDKSS